MILASLALSRVDKAAFLFQSTLTVHTKNPSLYGATYQSRDASGLVRIVRGEVLSV